LFLIATVNFVGQLFNSIQNGQYISEKEKVRQKKKLKRIYLLNELIRKIFHQNQLKIKLKHFNNKKIIKINRYQNQQHLHL